MASADFEIKNFFSGRLESVILSIEEDKDDEDDKMIFKYIPIFYLDNMLVIWLINVAVFCISFAI